LVGTGFFYLDGVYFLLDVKDALPLINYPGKNAVVGIGRQEVKARKGGPLGRRKDDVSRAMLRVHVRPI